MVRMISGDREALGDRVVVDLEERAAATLDLQRPSDQSAWRIVGQAHDDATGLVLDCGRALSDRAIALELRGQLVGAQTAGGGAHWSAGLRARMMAAPACS